MSALERAIVVLNGPARLADAVGVRANVVGNWRLRKQVPAEHCRAIEHATGGQVTRYELRPDVFGDPPANDSAPDQKAA